MSFSASHPRPSHPCGGDSHSRPLPSAMMTFKEEPLDEVVDPEPKQLVIDLTPGPGSAQPQGPRALQLQAGGSTGCYPDLHLQTSHYSDLKGSYSRYHPYPPRSALGAHPPAVMVNGDFCPANAAGNLLHPVMGGGGVGGGIGVGRGVGLSHGFGSSGDARAAVMHPRHEATDTRASRDTGNILPERSFHRFSSLSSSSTERMSLDCSSSSSSSGSNDNGTLSQPRARREFVPDHKKDGQYWNKRHKNNMSARRSRVKRKNMEKRMEHEMLDLQAENRELRLELEKLQKMFGLPVGSTDLASSPARSPESSSSSSLSSSSSGIGTSNASSPSSGGSAEHSASSSPALGPDEETAKSKPLGLQLKAAGKEATGGGGQLNGKRLERQLYHAACGDPDSVSALPYSPTDPHAIPAAMLSQARAQTGPPPAHFNSFPRQISQQDSDCHSAPRNSPPVAHGARGPPVSGVVQYASPGLAKNSSPMYPASAPEPFALYAGSLYRSSGNSQDYKLCVLSTPPLQQKNSPDGSYSRASSFSSSSSSFSSRYARVAVNSGPAPCIAFPSRGNNNNNSSSCGSATTARGPNRQSLNSDTSSEGSCSSYFQPDFSADSGGGDVQDHADLRERYSFSCRNSLDERQENGSGSDTGSAASQGGSPGQVSEDDNASSSSGSGESRRSSRSSTEEPECLHKIPLKCRMKRELHSAFSTSNLRSVK